MSFGQTNEFKLFKPPQYWNQTTIMFFIDEVEKQLNDPKFVKLVWEDITEALLNKGLHVSAHGCMKMWQILKCRYRKYKKQESLEEPQRTFPYFNRMTAIMEGVLNDSTSGSPSSVSLVTIRRLSSLNKTDSQVTCVEQNAKCWNVLFRNLRNAQKQSKCRLAKYNQEKKFLASQLESIDQRIQILERANFKTY